jgi:hypothetical protein
MALWMALRWSTSLDLERNANDMEGYLMLSSSFDIYEFIDKVKGRSEQEIIYLADMEATEAERHLYKSFKNERNETAGGYVALLKDVVLYFRHGVRTHAIRQINFPCFELTGRDC